MESGPENATPPRGQSIEAARQAVAAARHKFEKRQSQKRFRLWVRDEITAVTNQIEVELLERRNFPVEGKLARRVDRIPVLVDYCVKNTRPVRQLRDDEIPSITEGRLATDVIIDIIEEQQDILSGFDPDWE